jgi:pimeloyl-ACP methyl ester carboxylesterase
MLRLLLLCLLMTAPLCPAATPDTVVLLHGLARSPLSLIRLEVALRSTGYTVRNLDYPSRSLDIAALAEATLGPVFAAAPAATPRIHLVTHSLGGILVRQYLHDHGVPAALGRIVMLAPPNEGSEVVDRLRGWKLFQMINGPAGLELGTGLADGPRALGPLPAGVLVGVIAGDRTLNPFFSALLPGANDGKVAVAATHVAGETDHVTLPATHTWIMWRGDAVEQVEAFLRDGHFARNPTSHDGE